MQQKIRKMIRPPVFATVLVLGLVSGAAMAVPYQIGTLQFNTTDQSMWSSGAGFDRSESIFVGTEWTDKIGTLGSVVGGVTNERIPTNPLWYLWKACPFLCGSEPNPKNETLTVDTRTGAEVTVATSGKLGLEFGYSINSGTVDAMADFNVTAEIPTEVLDLGATVNLNTGSALVGGTLSSQSPWVEAYMKGIAQLSGR